jgi:hypothetical protein
MDHVRASRPAQLRHPHAQFHAPSKRPGHVVTDYLDIKAQEDMTLRGKSVPSWLPRIVHLERQLRHRKDTLGHVDATLRLLDPSIDAKAIPNKRYPKRVKLFRQGELGRLILGALRDGNCQPVTPCERLLAAFLGVSPMFVRRSAAILKDLGRQH